MKKQKKKQGEFLTPQRVALLLILILLLAFGLRFAFFYQMGHSPIAKLLIEDSKTYNDWALQIAGGDWMGKEVFYALPLYPYFLGLLYTIFGYHLQLIKFIQVLIGTFNCYLLFRLGKRLFNPAVALLAAFFMAAYAWLIVYDSSILSPVLIILLELLLLLYLEFLRRRPRKWWVWLGAGLLLGITTTVSGHLLLLVPLLIVWLWLSFPDLSPRRKGGASAIYLLGFVLAVAPVTLHNWLIGDDFIPITAHGGINFYIGNNPHSRGVFEPPPLLRSGGATLRKDSIKLAEKARGRKLKPSEVSSYWLDQGIDFIKKKPGLYLRLLGKKFVIFWDGLEIADVLHPYFFKRFAPVLNIPLLIFRIIAPLSLLGVFLSWKLRKRLIPLYLLLGAYIFSMVLFFINSRYRLPLVPLLMLFAAYPFYWEAEKLREKKWGLITISLISLAALIIFVNPGLLGKKHARFVLNMGAGYNHLGTYYSQQGDLPHALEEFKTALRLEPYRPEAHYNLANIYYRLERYDLALRYYREAIRLNPFYDSARLMLGSTYQKKGETAKAKKEYLEIIKNLPRTTMAYLRLGQLYLTEGKIEPAIRFFLRARELEPRSALPYLQLSLAYQKKKDYDRAAGLLEEGLRAVPAEGRFHLELARLFRSSLRDPEREYRHLLQAVRLLPDNYFVRLWLGDNFYRQGRRAAARAEWKKALRIKPGDPAATRRLEGTPSS